MKEDRVNIMCKIRLALFEFCIFNNCALYYVCAANHSLANLNYVLENKKEHNFL